MRCHLSVICCALIVLVSEGARSEEPVWWHADQVEEPAGGAAHFQVAPTYGWYGLGYDYAVRLKSLPILGSTFGPGAFWEGDSDALFLAPLLTLRLLPTGMRVAPYIGVGAGYYYNFFYDEGIDDVPHSGDDPRAESHVAVHGEAGLRIRLNGGGCIDLGIIYRHPFRDAPPGEDEEGQLIGKIGFGTE